MASRVRRFSTLMFIGRGLTRPQGGFLSLIGWISVVGLALGVATLVVVTSVMNGFERELRERILGVVSQALVQADGPEEDWRGMAQALVRAPGVLAAAPYVAGEGLMLGRGGRSQALFVLGIDPGLEPGVSILPEFFVQGSLDDLAAGEYGVLLGTTIAKQLSVDLDDRVTLVLPSISSGIAGLHPRIRSLRVRGLFHIGSELDGQLVYVHHADAASLFRTGGISSMRLRVDDLFAAGEIAREAARLLAEDPHWGSRHSYHVQDWTRTHGTLFQAIQLEQKLIALMLFAIVAVACFNVMATLVMTVDVNREGIAILGGLGASRGFVGSLFLLQGFWVGCMGTGAGLLLGLGLALHVEDAFAWLDQNFGLRIFEAYFIRYLPSEVHWDEVVLTAVSAVGLATLAGIYPARLASRMDPAEVLRRA